jgi:hypothetical protein
VNRELEEDNDWILILPSATSGETNESPAQKDGCGRSGPVAHIFTSFISYQSNIIIPILQTTIEDVQNIFSLL